MIYIVAYTYVRASHKARERDIPQRDWIWLDPTNVNASVQDIAGRVFDPDVDLVDADADTLPWSQSFTDELASRGFPVSKRDGVRQLSKQIVIRVTPEMYKAIQKDAEENGRTPTQSVRFHLKKAIM